MWLFIAMLIHITTNVKTNQSANKEFHRAAVKKLVFAKKIKTMGQKR
jgi:hypothetical protein